MLRAIIPENRLRVYDVRRVIETLADTGSVLELRRGFGPGMVTALVRIEGRPLGLIANNPTHLAGAIDSDGADKAARFMQLCDAFDLPLLFLCDTPGIMVGPEVEKTALVRHASRMFVTGASLTVPFFTIVLRKGYGLGAQAMAGGSFKAPLFTVAWPTGEFGGMGLEGAVKLGYRNELAAIDDPAERKALFDEMVERMYEHGKAVNDRVALRDRRRDRSGGVARLDHARAALGAAAAAARPARSARASTRGERAMSDAVPRPSASGPVSDEAAGLAPGRARLSGRRILVVGAGTQPSPEADAPIGNGRAIALLAAREGAAVACADRDEGAARDTLAQIEKEGGRGAVIVGDVADAAACERIVAEAEQALGGLDGLVLNVGIAAGARLAGTDAEAWDRTFAVNLRAHFLIARAALPRLSPGAALVFISSVAALGPGSQLPSYDASKAGLAGLMRHVAFEGARRGVRANVILPGLDRHAARPQRHARPALARAHARAARPPGHGLGGRLRDALPALGRSQLRDRSVADRRRRALRADLSRRSIDLLAEHQVD